MVKVKIKTAILNALLISSMVTMPAFANEPDTNWPQWRGPLANGVSLTGNPPITWSETENIRWKVSIPGRGHSTPVVWDDRVVLTTAIPVGNQLDPIYSDAPGAHDNVPVTQKHQYAVMAVSRRDGSCLWQRIVKEVLPHEGGHYTASLASHSPVTDGERIYAFFGSRGLYCLTWDGVILWTVELGQLKSKHGHGEGASPVLFNDTIVVNSDHEGASFIVAIDKHSGRQRWKVARDEVTSWATPIVVPNGEKSQVVVSGTDRVRGYDLDTGDVIWECGGLSANIIASPVSSNGIVYVGSSYETRALMAIRIEGASGDITDTDQVLWNRFQATPYVPSPLLYKGSLYVLRHYQGILSRVVAETGDEPTGPFRLGGIGNVYASPVAVSDRIYITDLDGATIVISASNEPDVLAFNRLRDRFSASAAISGSDLFLRGMRYLYCIGSPD